MYWQKEKLQSQPTGLGWQQPAKIWGCTSWASVFGVALHGHQFLGLYFMGISLWGCTSWVSIFGFVLHGYQSLGFPFMGINLRCFISWVSVSGVSFHGYQSLGFHFMVSNSGVALCGQNHSPKSHTLLRSPLILVWKLSSSGHQNLVQASSAVSRSTPGQSHPTGKSNPKTILESSWGCCQWGVLTSGTRCTLF